MESRSRGGPERAHGPKDYYRTHPRGIADESSNEADHFSISQEVEQDGKILKVLAGTGQDHGWKISDRPLKNCRE